MRKLEQKKYLLPAYLLLFVLCLLTVAHMIPYPVTLRTVALAVLPFRSWYSYKSGLFALLTFVGFFIFCQEIWEECLLSVISAEDHRR